MDEPQSNLANIDGVAPPPATTKGATTRAAEAPGTPILSQSEAVGQGFNVFGPLAISSLIKPLFDYSAAPTNVFTFLGVDYLVPSFITAVEDTAQYSANGTCETREAFQNSVAAHAGVEVSFGAFSGEMAADYARHVEQSSQYAYAYRNTYCQLAYLELNGGTQYLTPEFRAAIAALPDSVDETNFVQFFSFFETYGAYYTQRVVLGGQCSLYAAVGSAASVSSSQLSVMFNAQYDGLFSSGSISGSITSSAAWRAYTSNASFSVVARGGTPTTVGGLVSVPPLDPSHGTVAAFDAWLASLGADPAVVDFQLAGIWQLCGDKAPAVQSAWELFGNVMHPHLTIQTQCARVPWPLGSITPPVVMLGNAIVPVDPPASPAGYQLIVMDNRSLVDEEGDAAGVLLNKYYAVPPTSPNWMMPDPAFPGHQLWQHPYNQMAADIQAKGLASKDNVLVLVGFSMDGNMPPMGSMLALLQNAGGGPALANWSADPDAGSESGNPNVWVAVPTAYVLVGYFGQGPGTGVEALTWASHSPASLAVDVYFYRQIYGGRYTLAQG